VKLDGRVVIRAPRPAVWAMVIDPGRIAGCLPGAPAIETLDAGRFRATATVKLGFLRASVVVDVELADLHEPEVAALLAHGRAPGSTVDVSAKIRLDDGPEGSTHVAWSADVAVGGLLAGVGAAQVEETVTRLAAETLDCLRARLKA
jgi:carbon monoxide dehydrogenase subunit G